MNDFDDKNNNPDMGGDPQNRGQYQQQDYQQNNQQYQQPNYQQNQQYQQQNYQQQPIGYQQKSKMAAGLLGIFLGSWGVHNFYLGFTNKAIIQIIVSIVTCGVGGIWGFIEGIMILASNNTVDSNGVPLSN